MTETLYRLIFNRLHGMTHRELSERPQRMAGFFVPEGEGLSKADRIKLALDGLSARELARIGKQMAEALGDLGLDEAALLELESDDPPITEITRRDVARVFEDDLAGERPLLEMVERLFELQSPIESLFGPSGKSLRDQIERHMVRNPGDWSVEDLFLKIGALQCSRARFAALIEAAVHPLARRGEAQATTVAAVNQVLARDGYELAPCGEESGYPIFRLQPVARGVRGRPKNLIFASRGPKPEIGFADAINNDIVILSGADSCLVYDRPIGADGLLWSQLVDWWARHPEGGTEDPAARLGARLQQSLASDAERKLFATYFKHFRPTLGAALPALIPQVYLHYDPAVVKTLSRRLPLPRQRMDFLLLLPRRQRVVLEVDGSHHFSRDGQPSLAAYAEMVSADRELRLAGYEVYRFGANELVGSGAEHRIRDFFDKLFRLHAVLGASGG